MASSANSVEAKAIEDAYAGHVQMLYGSLVKSLIDTRGNEAEGMRVFRSGLAFAKRAREIALDAVGPQTPAAATRRGSARGRRRER